MDNRVCVVGIGVVEAKDPMVDLSHKEMLFYATSQALDDAGLERKDIGSAITTSFDFLEGRSLSNQYTLDSIGGVMKPCDLRLGEDGIYSLFAGYMEVMSDPSQVVVVASVQKASERDPDGLGYQKLIADSMEPVFSRPVCKSVPNLLGLEPVLAAMEARVFMDRTG
jgi:acetyl-CoA acetyltransferase